ncbi:MAG: D-glycero-D-manno-heptose 1,7-bisphosphate phosphatase [Candidatus Krumholzibacteriia bacterium]|jgi:D-glycero-D-manno-heptose 1,7-bisphosphate phosphatase
MSVWLKAQSEKAGDHSVLFLDRDGVVIVDQDYLADPAGVVLVPGAAKAIRKAREMGMLVIGVSNQSGLGRGLFSERDFGLVMDRISELLAQEGGAWDGFYYCPHAPNDGCGCRKPLSGLLTEASEAISWNPATSWVVGDKVSDIALGRRAQLSSVLVETGYGKKARINVETAFAEDPRVLYASDLTAALEKIVSRPEMSGLGADS